MIDQEQHRRNQYKSEADAIWFRDMVFDDNMKRKVLAMARTTYIPSGRSGWLATRRKKWLYGVSAAAIAALVAVSIPWLYNPAEPNQVADPGFSSPEPGVMEPGPQTGNPPAAEPDGSAGSSLSELITVSVATPEEAKQRFGEDLLAPAFVPEGYQLTDIQTTGTAEDQATQVIYHYQSGDQTLTVMIDRHEATLPLDFFTPTQVNGSDGYVFAQQGFTELYWIADGIQFGIVGPVTEEEAMQVAASLQ